MRPVLIRGHRPPGGRTRLDVADIYDRHAERILVFLARRCLDPEVAIDLLAETFAQALEGHAKYRGNSEDDAVAWIYGIARNLLANYFRRGQAEARAVRRLGIQTGRADREDLARVEELADLQQVRRLLEGHLCQLSAGQRQALRFRVIDELPYPEVARRMAVSEDTARARVSRALRRLAQGLDHTQVAQGGVGHDST